MRAATRSGVLAFVLLSSSSHAGNLPDSCVGNFCMFKPLTEKQFVARYGDGVLRREDAYDDVHHRCFYNGLTKQWVEFQFSRHGDREPRHMEGVTLGHNELCSSRYQSRRPMNLKIAKGSVAIGMSANDVLEKLGHPSKIMLLEPHAPNILYDRQFGKYAWLYESSEDELLFNAIYIEDGKMVNFRLLFSE